MSAIRLPRFAGNFRKVMLSVGAVGAASSIAGLGTFAGFNSSTSASQQVATGTVEIRLGDNGGVNRLNVNADKVAAGDTIQRAVQLSNTGTIDLSSVTLTTTLAPNTSGNVLTTDATNGLQLKVDRCSVPWTETSPSTGVYTYACSGDVSSVVASRPVIGAGLDLGSAALTPASSDNLRVTLNLPSAADNTFQAKTAGLVYTFVATQRVAADR